MNEQRRLTGHARIDEHIESHDGFGTRKKKKRDRTHKTKSSAIQPQPSGPEKSFSKKEMPIYELKPPDLKPIDPVFGNEFNLEDNSVLKRIEKEVENGLPSGSKHLSNRSKSHNISFDPSTVTQKETEEAKIDNNNDLEDVNNVQITNQTDSEQLLNDCKYPYFVKFIKNIGNGHGVHDYEDNIPDEF